MHYLNIAIARSFASIVVVEYGFYIREIDCAVLEGVDFARSLIAQRFNICPPIRHWKRRVIPNIHYGKAILHFFTQVHGFAIQGVIVAGCGEILRVGKDDQGDLVNFLGCIEAGPEFGGADDAGGVISNGYYPTRTTSIGKIQLHGVVH